MKNSNNDENIDNDNLKNHNTFKNCYIGKIILTNMNFIGATYIRVSKLSLHTWYRGFESRSGRDNFQTIITPSSYSTCPGLSIKWTGRRLVTDSGTKCAWVIHESKAVQIHVHHSNRRCLYVPRVPGSVKNPHNNNNITYFIGGLARSTWIDFRPRLTSESTAWIAI